MNKNKLIWILLLVVIGVGLIWFYPSKAARPNVIFVVIDSLRADHLSAYGYERKTSPHLERLAQDSLVFERAFSQAPWTTPSIASMMTSKYPSALGFGGHGHPGFISDTVIIDPSFETLAEMLKRSGYQTQGIISHTYLSSRLGLGQGFDSYDEENAKGEGYISSPSITQKAKSFITQNQKAPFFLFLHYFDPHYDFQVHEGCRFDNPSYQGPIRSGQRITEVRKKVDSLKDEDLEQLKSIYDSEICFTDRYLGKLMEHLRDLKLYDNSLIIVTADHGETFAERANRWIGHGRNLHQELIRVPLIVKTPRQKQTGWVQSGVALLDILPSVADWLQLKNVDQRAWEGYSLRQHENRKMDLIREIYSETVNRFVSYVSLVRGPWKYIQDTRSRQEQLFNHDSDFNEYKDLKKDKADQVKKMRYSFGEWENRMKREQQNINVEEADFSEQQIANLKSLSYL